MCTTMLDKILGIAGSLDMVGWFTYIVFPCVIYRNVSESFWEAESYNAEAILSVVIDVVPFS